MTSIIIAKCHYLGHYHQMSRWRYQRWEGHHSGTPITDTDQAFNKWRSFGAFNHFSCRYAFQDNIIQLGGK